jgi:hypothetical protein
LDSKGLSWDLEDNEEFSGRDMISKSPTIKHTGDVIFGHMDTHGRSSEISLCYWSNSIGKVLKPPHVWSKGHGSRPTFHL